MSSQQIAVRSSTDLASLNEFKQILLGLQEAPEIIEDPELISREILLQILNAQNEEELENFGNATGWRDLQDVPMLLQGFRWRPSSYEEGGPIYVIVQAICLGKKNFGERMILTTGSQNVLAQLAWLAEHEKLPGAIRELTYASETPTSRGFRPLALKTPANAEELRTLYEGEVSGGNPLDEQ